MKENSPNTNNNLSMEWTIENQTNINLLNIYNNPSIEWSANFTQGYEGQSNNILLPTEWSMNLTQDQTNISLPNVYNNSSIEWTAGLSKDQINNNLPIVIEWPTDFTNNNPFIERNADFTQYHTNTNTSLPNIYNNPTIESFAGITRNDGDQTNHKLPIACLTEDQNNTCLPKIYNAGVTQHCEEQINTLQQYNSKSVKKNKHSVSLDSRHERNTIFICMACQLKKKRYRYDKNSNQCKECYQASSRTLSGIKFIDDFIKSAQTFSTRKNCRINSKLEFIPYEQFTNTKYLAKGGFSEIYKATWVDGPIVRWNPKKPGYYRKKNCGIVLKILNNSQKMDYLNELKNFILCRRDNIITHGGIHQYFGITQDPETKNYIIVIELAQNRDLHYFLTKKPLSWSDKLTLLHKISIGLNLVHKKKIIHRDLHSGNILINGDGTPTIADLGISKPMYEVSIKDAIYGVIPYVAPEVLKGGRFTQASDIYSFGMIIWEVITGYRPFSDRVHDEHLILKILDGHRPKIPADFPQDLIKLIEKCWHQDPEKRKFITPEEKKIIEQWEKNHNRKEKQRIGGDLGIVLNELVIKAEKGEIKFPEERDTSILSTKKSNQGIYYSRPLTTLISKALTLQSLKLNSNVIADILNQANDSKEIYFDINKNVDRILSY